MVSGFPLLNGIRASKGISLSMKGRLLSNLFILNKCGKKKKIH